MEWPGCGIEAAATAMVGVVEATAGIAATGTIVVDSDRTGRLVSLLPRVGVFVLREADVVPLTGTSFAPRGALAGRTADERRARDRPLALGRHRDEARRRGPRPRRGPRRPRRRLTARRQIPSRTPCVRSEPWCEVEWVRYGRDAATRCEPGSPRPRGRSALAGDRGRAVEPRRRGHPAAARLRCARSDVLPAAWVWRR